MLNVIIEGFKRERSFKTVETLIRNISNLINVGTYTKKIKRTRNENILKYSN